MDKHYFLKLLQKQVDETSTTEEDQLLKNYYQLFETEPEVQELKNAASKQQLQSEIFKEISAKINASEQTISRKRNRSIVLKLAAAAVITVICVNTFLFYQNPKADKSSVAGASNENHNNKPIFLSDGSTVILSYGSKLYSAPNFGGKTREVYLEGQAYFDIRHNDAKPFIVHSGKLETTVLGTAFTIKAMPGDDAITVTVTRGKVKISDNKKILGLITRGQQIVYYEKKDSAIKNTVNAQPEWTRQDLLLDNVTVAEAAKLLEDRFNVKITINDSLVQNNRFTTVFLKTENLDQVLKSICAFNDAEYLFEDGEVIIVKK